jgi:hypothetical protein
VGDRGPELHVLRAAEHQFTLIGMITRRWPERRAEYEPYPTRVVRIGAALEDAPIDHDHLARLKPSCGERLVEQQAAELSSPGNAYLHVGRADNDQLTPAPGNANQETDGRGRVRLTRHDLAVEDDDASRLEPLDPDYVLEPKPITPGPKAWPL